MKKNVITSSIYFALIVSLSGCAEKRPVLYPNAHFKEVGQLAANRGIDDCLQMANEHQVDSSKAGTIAKDAGKAGAVGAATGAVIGLITGDFGRAAAIGGVGAATAAAGSGVMRSDEPDALFKQFVEQCLREKGFQPIGWR